MKVLYLSKALVVAEYRTKLGALGRGAEVVAVVPERWGGRPAEEVGTGDGTIRFRPSIFQGHNHFHLYRGLGEILDAERPDLVHVDEEPYSAVTLQAVRLCRPRRIPALFFAWQNLNKRLPPPFGAVRRGVFGAVAGGIAGTPAAARVLRDSGYTGPLAVVPQFGVDAERFRPDPERRDGARAGLGLTDDRFLVGFAGRLVREKGVHHLLRALSELPRVETVIAGEGPEEERLRALARSRGIEARVRFVGRIASTRMPEFLAGLDALALPSIHRRGWAEQFGRVLVEAMACGVPVIASRSGEIPHVVGDAGVLVEEGNVEALRAAIGRLAHDELARHRFSCDGRARVLQHFTQERIAGDTLLFYQELLDGRRS